MKGDISLLTVEGFEKALKYWKMFEEGLVCTVSLSFFTVIFGFIFALILALMRMSNFRPLGFIAPNNDKGGVLNAISNFRPLNFIASVYTHNTNIPYSA